MTLSIVIPAYSEAKNLVHLLPRLREVSAKLCPDFEICIVDTTEPTDNTEEVCRDFGARYVRREINNDFGNAIRTGIKHAKGRYVLMMDADGSHDPDFIPELWEKRDEADIVIASRFTPGGKTDNPFLLTAMSKVLNLAFRFVVGTTVYDTSGGFRLYNGDVLRSLRTTCSHFDVLQEILVKITHNDPARVLEVPYHFRERAHGESKRRLLAFGVNYLVTLYKLRKVRRGLVGAGRPKRLGTG